jgi:adenylate cyclase class IV
MTWLDMARNVEIKAFAPNFTELMNKAKSLKADEPETIEQTDVFFKTDRGRLKLRFLSPTRGELIFYERADQAGPKMSVYSIYVTGNPLDLRAVLSATYGEDVTVEKVRTLFLIGKTRVHLDDVRHLGQFVELEVVLENGQAAEEGIAEVHRLMDKLGIRQENLIDGAYADLLRASRQNPEQDYVDLSRVADGSSARRPR